MVSPLVICTLIVCSCAALFVPKLLRFKRYRERVQYRHLRKPRKPRKIPRGCMGFESGLFDPESEAQLFYLELWMQDKERYENAMRDPGLSVEERAGLELAYLEQETKQEPIRRQKERQKLVALLAEEKVRTEQQRQEWEAMKQIAATKSLWWQFWHCT